MSPDWEDCLSCRFGQGCHSCLLPLCSMRMHGSSNVPHYYRSVNHPGRYPHETCWGGVLCDFWQMPNRLAMIQSFYSLQHSTSGKPKTPISSTFSRQLLEPQNVELGKTRVCVLAPGFLYLGVLSLLSRIAFSFFSAVQGQAASLLAKQKSSWETKCKCGACSHLQEHWVSQKGTNSFSPHRSPFLLKGVWGSCIYKVYFLQKVVWSQQLLVSCIQNSRYLVPFPHRFGTCYNSEQKLKFCSTSCCNNSNILL